MMQGEGWTAANLLNQTWPPVRWRHWNRKFLKERDSLEICLYSPPPHAQEHQLPVKKGVVYVLRKAEEEKKARKERGLKGPNSPWFNGEVVEVATVCWENEEPYVYFCLLPRALLQRLR